MLLLALAGCGAHGDSNGGDPPNDNFFGGPNIPTASGPGQFTYPPIPLADVSDLVPLGAMNGGGHTQPTDHVYFYMNTAPNPINVLAPGAGWVTLIFNPGDGPADSKVMIQMTPTFTYYLDGILPDPSIVMGGYVAAGQIVGTTGQAGALDLGVADAAVTVPWVNPARYGLMDQHCASPFKYFTPDIQAEIYPLVDRAGPDKDSTICYDVAGTLSGNWFATTLAEYATLGNSPAAAAGDLCFAYDCQDPTQPLISLGNALDDVGTGPLKPPPGAPVFQDVTPASGKVDYQLLLEGSGLFGLMIVQMTDASTLQLEVFPGSTATDAEFDANALTYYR